MMVWCMAHPWMTFFLWFWAITMISSSIIAIANAIALRSGEKSRQENEEVPQNGAETAITAAESSGT